MGGGVEGQESDRCRVALAPKRPSADEVASHLASGHAAYRAWCPHCVAGKAKAAAHRSTDGTESALPEICADFAEIRNPWGSVHRILVCKCRSSCSFAATSLDNGLADNPASIRFLKGWLEYLGHRGILMKTDGEPALKSLMANGVAAVPGLEATPRVSPPGDAAANGLAERAVSEIKSHCRVLFDDCPHRRHGTTQNPKS